MNEQEIVSALQSKAAQGIPDTVDVWPAVEAQVRGRTRGVPWQPVRLVVAGAAAVFLAAVAFGAVRWHVLPREGVAPLPATVPASADQEVALASWVMPEVYPDLATLTAATELAVRGRATGADQFAIEEVLLNRLGVDPAQVKLRLIQQPPDAPALLSDPLLVPGEEYILFLHSFYGFGSEQYRQGDRTFRPVGGPQGQWPLQGGQVMQSADVPLKAQSGMAVAAFVETIRTAPDPRIASVALLKQHGWAPNQPWTVRIQALPTAEAIARTGDYQDWLVASRAIGLDWAPYAGQQVLWLQYSLGPGELRFGQGIDEVSATVLVAQARPIGAWLRAGGWMLVFPLDRRDEALAAAVDPNLRPTPTPDPHPLGERPNLAQRYGLAGARDMWVKGMQVQGGLVRDEGLRERLIAALDSEIPVQRLGVGEVPPDHVDTVLVVFDLSDGQTVMEGDYVALRYHLDEGQVYIYDRGVAFSPPPAFVEALAPLLGPLPTVAPGEPIARPTEAAVPPVVPATPTPMAW